MTLVMIHAAADSIRWQVDNEPPVTTTVTQVSTALTDSILTGTATVAGHTLDESQLIELMNSMRGAAGLTRCDQCRSWTDTGDLCAECARAERLADHRIDDSMGAQ